MFKVMSLLCFAATASRGAMITGGTIVFTQSNGNLGGYSRNQASFLLNDGVSVAGTISPDNGIANSCEDLGSGCSLQGQRYLDVGSSSGFNPGLASLLTFSYASDFRPSRSFALQTFSTTFTVSGTTYNFYSACPFSEIPGPLTNCSVPTAGFGTALITATQIYDTDGTSVFYVSSEVLTFAPEPATWLLLIVPCGYLLARRTRHS